MTSIPPILFSPELPVVFPQVVSFSVRNVSQKHLISLPTATPPTETYLNHQTPDPLPAVPHPNSHVAQHRRVPNVRGVRITMDVRRPLKLRGVGMASTHVTGL
jgi:predicted component of type VI protein secretion system